jgi:DNA-binding NarL/FixJ family response regulator
MESPISLFLVDDHRIFSQSFEAYVSTQPGFLWKGSADGSGHSIRQIIQSSPMVVLLDFHLRDLNGLEFLKRLREQGFSGRIVMLTMNRDDQIRLSARNWGADGFVSKDADGQELLHGLRSLALGETDYLEIPYASRDRSDNPYSLTRQERLVAGLVCSGRNSEQISRELNISIHTVHTHRRRILDKTKSSTFMEVCQKLS